MVTVTGRGDNPRYTCHILGYNIQVPHIWHVPKNKEHFHVASYRLWHNIESFCGGDPWPMNFYQIRVRENIILTKPSKKNKISFWKKRSGHPTKPKIRSYSQHVLNWSHPSPKIYPSHLLMVFRSHIYIYVCICICIYIYISLPFSPLQGGFFQPNPTTGSRSKQKSCKKRTPSSQQKGLSSQHVLPTIWRDQSSQIGLFGIFWTNPQVKHEIMLGFYHSPLMICLLSNTLYSY